MTAHETLSHEAYTAWAELVYASRRGWRVAEAIEGDRAAALRELVDAGLASEVERGLGISLFELTDDGLRLWDAER